VSLHGAILDSLRASSQPNDAPVALPGFARESPVEDATASAEVWELLKRMLLDVREQRMAYLLFHCGLGPQEIVSCYSKEFSDVSEISRLRRTIMERFVCIVDLA
jgi:hypothetical protein